MSKFNVIVCDPPWCFGDPLKRMKAKTKRSAQSQYQTMSMDEIKQLSVKDLADPVGAVLVLWVPSSLLADGLDVMKTWGFEFKQTYVWVKTKKPKKKRQIVDLNDELAFGMGRLFRQAHEIALIGTSGKSVYSSLKNKSQRSVTLEPNMGHSIKPDALQSQLELMFPDSVRLEMFARRILPGWTCVGNSIDGKDIRDSIQDLIAL